MRPKSPSKKAREKRPNAEGDARRADPEGVFEIDGAIKWFDASRSYGFPAPGGSDTSFKRLSDGRIDGRSLRRTGRTENMTVRVPVGLSEQVKLLASQNGATIGQLVELAIRAWAANAPAATPVLEQPKPNTSTNTSDTKEEPAGRTFFDWTIPQRLAFLCTSELMPRVQLIQLNERILREGIDSPETLGAAIIDVRGDPSFAATDRAMARGKYIYEKMLQLVRDLEQPDRKWTARVPASVHAGQSGADYQTRQRRQRNKT